MLRKSGSPPIRAAGQGHAAASVRQLCLREAVELDGDRLVEWVVAEGEVEAQRQIDDAFRALAEQTAALVDEVHAAADISGPRIARLCDQIASGARFAGLPRYAQVAQDVAACAARRDGVATQAVLHRLVRMSAQALRQSWDMALT